MGLTALRSAYLLFVPVLAALIRRVSPRRLFRELNLVIYASAVAANHSA